MSKSRIFRPTATRNPRKSNRFRYLSRLANRCLEAVKKKHLEDYHQKIQSNFHGDAYWKTIALTKKKLYRILEKSSTSLPGPGRIKLVEDLSINLRSQIEEVRTKIDFLFYGLPKSIYEYNPLTIRDVLENLRVLDDEFPNEWEYDRHEIRAKTSRVILRDVDFGPFLIHLKFPDFHLECEALEPHENSENVGRTHPHIDGVSLCTGNGTESLSKTLKDCRIGDYFAIVNSILHTYSQDSAYVSIEEFVDGGSFNDCANCGSRHDSEDTGICCEACGDGVCGDCFCKCGNCECYFCLNCVVNCDDCQDGICEECKLNCSDCEKNVCKSCLESCSYCDKGYCKQCFPCYVCESCGNEHCEDCVIKCEECDGNFCKSCLEIKTDLCKDCYRNLKEKV